MDPNISTNNANLPFPANSIPSTKEKQRPIQSAQKAIENSTSETAKALPTARPRKNAMQKPQRPALKEIKTAAKEVPISKANTEIEKNIKKAQEGVTPFTIIENFFISLENLDDKQNFLSLVELYFEEPLDILESLDSIASTFGTGEELDKCIHLLTTFLSIVPKNSMKENFINKLEDSLKKVKEIDPSYQHFVTKIIKQFKESSSLENLTSGKLSEESMDKLCMQYHIRYEEGKYMNQFLKMHIFLWNLSSKYQEIIKAYEDRESISLGFMDFKNARNRFIEMGRIDLAKELIPDKLFASALWVPSIHAVVIKYFLSKYDLADAMAFEITNALQQDRYEHVLNKALSGGFIDPNFHDAESSIEKAAYQYAMAIEQIELDGRQICEQVLAEVIASSKGKLNWKLEPGGTISENQFLSEYGRTHIESYKKDYVKFLRYIHQRFS